jgi:hypothetical protein
MGLERNRMEWDTVKHYSRMEWDTVKHYSRMEYNKAQWNGIQ